MATAGKLEARILVPTGGWDMALTDASGGPTTVTLPAGYYYLSSDGDQGVGTDLPTYLTTLANAAMTATWTVSVDASGIFTITNDGATCTCTFTDTELRDLLGFTLDLSAATSYTGTRQCPAVWLPTLPFQELNSHGNWRGWPESDMRSIETAGGHVYSIMGRSKNINELTWPMEPRNKTWSANETTVNESFESFLRKGIWGVSDWGTPGGPIRFYPDETDTTVFGTYKCVDLMNWKPGQVREHFAGLWEIATRRLVQVPDDALLGLASAPAAYTLDTLTPANIATITGKAAPTIMWDCGVASGAEDLAGTDDLTDVGSPTKEVSDTALGGLTTEIVTPSTDALTAASNTVGDVGAETVTFVWIGRPTAYSATRSVFNKRESTGSLLGYELYTNSSGHFAWSIDGPSNANIETVAVAHGTTNAQVVLGTLEYAADNQALYTREGSSINTRTQQSLTNTETLTIGDSLLKNALLARHGKLMLWIGTDGDGFDNTDRLAIAEALGYE